MRKYIILLLALSLLAAGAAAQDNGTAANAPKKLTGVVTEINFDTGGATGHLVYEELYYSKNKSGNLTRDTGRKFFDGNITSSRVRMKILRPVDRAGNMYPDSRIRAIATLDGKVIMDGWYKPSKPQGNTSTGAGNATKPDAATPAEKSPGFEWVPAVAALIALGLYRTGRGEGR